MIKPTLALESNFLRIFKLFSGELCVWKTFDTLPDKLEQSFGADRLFRIGSII